MDTEIFTGPEHWCLLVLIFSLLAIQYIATPFFAEEHHKLIRASVMAGLSFAVFVALQMLCAMKQYWVGAAVLVFYMIVANNYLQKDLKQLWR